MNDVIICGAKVGISKKGNKYGQITILVPFKNKQNGYYALTKFCKLELIADELENITIEVMKEYSITTDIHGNIIGIN